MALITEVKNLSAGILPGMTAHNSQNNQYRGFNNPNGIKIIPGNMAFVNTANPTILVDGANDPAVRAVGIYHRDQSLSTDNATTDPFAQVPVGSQQERQPTVMVAGAIVVRTEADVVPGMLDAPFYRLVPNGAGKLELGSFRGDSDTGNAVQNVSLKVVDIPEANLATISFLAKLI